ncbi:MAG: peptide chain release factor 1 [Clostridiaceae bacterium]|nr:peptide chain release factor 1 [Clostridiales bacterium]MDD6877771.1 peptide chain release factor 1 [Clostridiaceae bacterium]MDY5014717.1 peptide chain release factor 1 [Eubacteriales bacterium]
MEEKLAALEERYDAIDRELQDPAVYSDPARAAKLSREQKELAPVVEAYRDWKRAVRDAADALELASEPEMRELAQEELDDAKERQAALWERLKVLLLPRDPNDGRNVIVEIRGGVGGEEAALFAAVLYRMYSMYAEAKGYKIEVINRSETELGGIKELSFLVVGDGAYSRFKFESGVHRVQRVPETEAGGRIHTSAASVAVLPEADDVEISIDPGDLQIDTYRSSGAGGQHVNKTESAIRITHLPTGLVVECQDERSQYKNRDRAMKILRSKLLEQERERQNAEIAAERRTMVGSGDRSERIRTYNYPQNRLTDHRINLTLYKLDRVLEGELDELIDALITADTAARLREGGQEA